MVPLDARQRCQMFTAWTGWVSFSIRHLSSFDRLHASPKLSIWQYYTALYRAQAGSVVVPTLPRPVRALLSTGTGNGYIGVLYTAMIPRVFRSKQGAYYTPPALCEQLLDMAMAAGVDWATAHVLDPACGGGAFLSPVARRMAASVESVSAELALRGIEWRLAGFEVDPFAAWLSQVFLDVTVGNLCRSAGRRLRPVVRVCDSHEQESASFDLVVGNPPYGRVTRSPRLRAKFTQSLFGHANL